MGIIKILPDHLINQIAAGEVIERPASVVKELIENSLDALSSRIVIEIEKAGFNLIKVSDNGIGMDREDAVLAFARHATSKISTAEDLFKIHSLGFRGEALPSIASVAEVTLKSRPSKMLAGTEVKIKGGKEPMVVNTGCPQGTQVEVKNLFFNTPARKKYLKKPETELGHILELVLSIALGYPEVGFRLVHNGKIVFDLLLPADRPARPAGRRGLPTPSLKERIQALLGKKVSNALIPVFYGGKDFSLEGFIGKPEIARNNRKHQFLFINQREVKNNLISYAVAEAYHSLLPARKYPVFILKIQLDPEKVDVNVHPRKAEVRFLDQNEVYRKVQASVKAALQKEMLAPEIGLVSLEEGGGLVSRPPQGIKKALEFTKDWTEGAREMSLEFQNETKTMLPLTQVGESYLIAQHKEGIVIIDPHAAHERILYSRLKENFEKKEPVKQPLLLPLELPLSPREAQILESSLELFKKLGFEIEAFSGNTFMIDAVPDFLAQDDIQEVILGVLDDLLSEKEIRRALGRQEKIIQYLACRGAVKLGKKLGLREQIALISALEEAEKKYTCPHGRPTMILLTFDELEKKFGRK